MTTLLLSCSTRAVSHAASSLLPLPPFSSVFLCLLLFCCLFLLRPSSSSCFRRVSHSSFPFFLFLFYLFLFSFLFLCLLLFCCLFLLRPLPLLVFVVFPTPPSCSCFTYFSFPSSSSSCFYSFVPPPPPPSFLSCFFFHPFLFLLLFVHFLPLAFFCFSSPLIFLFFMQPFTRLRKVRPGYNDIGLCDTSPITSGILRYQLIPHC